VVPPILTPIPVLKSVRELLSHYDVLLCDVWGVVHDGRTAYPGANDTLTRFRGSGGTVILVSNAPMPSDVVATVCDEKGVVRSAWDAIVSSGDIALAHIAEHNYRRVYCIGPRPRDSAFFDRLPGIAASLEVADVIACTGLVDDRIETPEDYRATLAVAHAHKLPLICANPDLAVHVGRELLPCAGAIATLYEDLGGQVFWAGKPHQSAYTAGLVAAERMRGQAINKARVLGIGDAVRTDIAAAKNAGVDSLLIAQGLHRDEIMHDGNVDAVAANKLLNDAELPAVAIMSGLSW
jgi:HAD superfamily hydrolase (TIGR01459 family)